MLSDGRHGLAGRPFVSNVYYLRGAAGTGETPEKADGGAAGPIHVLFVDDDVAVREAIAELLRLEGLEITEVNGGRAALEALRRDETIAFLLTDLSMAEMDGIAVVHAAREIRPSLPAAILTGYAAEADRVAPTRLTIFHKPADPEPIARHIRRAVSGGPR